MSSSQGPLLVTGADGFIGSHVVEAAVRDGYRVRAFVHYNSFSSWGWLDQVAPDVRGQFEVVAGDIRDPHGMLKAVRGCDTVMHLAALIAIPFSYDNPQSYVETNATGTLNVLEACRAADVRRLICTSTSEVYGTAQYVPIDERHPLNAQSPYAATKIAADQLALSFHHSFGVPVSVLRPFNTYGPRQSARAVIPTIISQVAAGKRQIRLGSLHPTRDFTFVQDTARGFLQIAKCDAAIGQVVNIGSDFEVSIAQTVEMIGEAMGAAVEPVLDDERLRPIQSEVERLWAGTALARELFGWAPRFAGREGFIAGLAETADWFRNPEHLAMYKHDRYNV